MASRRNLITGSAAGLAATVAAAGPAAAQGQPSVPPHPFEMPRNMTLLTFQRDGRYCLGVKTPKGILDVSAAASALGLPAPADMDDLLQKGSGEQANGKPM